MGVSSIFKRNFMPFYEYQCKACGHTLEAMQKINDSPLKKCPECGKSQLTRLMSAPVFRLKGGGWYETDFKGEQDHKKNLADRPEADASKEEAKPAEAKTAEATSGDAAKTDKAAEKTADKPAEKAVVKAETPKKTVSTGISKRGATAKPPVRTAKKVAKKPLARPKVKARR
jgi:putative FmdB family regulatory protein